MHFDNFHPQYHLYLLGTCVVRECPNERAPGHLRCTRHKESIYRGSQNTPEYDFLRRLKDVLLLLGCLPEVTDLVKLYMDGKITEAEVELLKNYCLDLQQELERRQLLCSKMTVTVKRTDED